MVTMMEKASTFISRGTPCVGTLYLPEGERPPVIVMAHGFGAERVFRLPAYAERFVARGLAVFLFDYRNFGDSAGQPRNLVSPRRHIQDWGAAIEHVRGMREVDGGRMGLWGTSFSGGHVMVAAAKFPPVRAVVSQVPFVDGLAVAIHFKPGFVLQATYHALRDAFRMVTFRSPHNVPVIARPDSFGLMNTPDAFDGAMALVPEGMTWKNFAPARISLALPLYRPTMYAARVDCPVLVIGADKDTLVPQSSVRRAVAKMKDAEMVSRQVGHFDVYVGEEFEQVVELQAEFLARHLLNA